MYIVCMCKGTIHVYISVIASFNVFFKKENDQNIVNSVAQG